MFPVRKKMSHKGVLFFRNIPADLKHMFKGVCNRRGDSMQGVIEALMRAYIKRPDMVRPRKRSGKAVFEE